MDIFEEYAHLLASSAQRAVLYEAVTAPKPGLVDRYGQGSHKDMDIFTFMSSSSALYKGIYECALTGAEKGYYGDKKLLDAIRPIGVECEKNMLSSTLGVNTHKGIIFSMGILCTAMGRLYNEKRSISIQADKVCQMVSQMCQGLVERELYPINSQNTDALTHGEKLFLDYGIRGIRGEVEDGFKTVLDYGMPVLRNPELRKRLSLNDLLLHTLMSIMTYCEDTNVIIRGGIGSLNMVKESARAFMQDGGMLSKDAYKKLEDMDRFFIQRNISPGGSADLLSVSIFLCEMEGIALR